MKKRLIPMLIAGLLIVVIMVGMERLCGKTCLMRILLGIPCPSCGLTRAGILFLTGHPIESMKMQPAFLPIMLMIPLFIYEHYYKKNMKHPLFLGYAAVVVVLLIVVYVHGMITYYPNKEPYIHDEYSVLDMMIHGH